MYGKSPSKKEREQYNQHRERVGKELGIEKKHYNALRRVGQSLSKHDTDYANGATGGGAKYVGNKIVNRYEDKQHSKDVGKAFSKAEALRQKMGGKSKMHFYHQTDPRGASLYVGKKRMSGNDYRSKGHVIY